MHKYTQLCNGKALGKGENPKGNVMLIGICSYYMYINYRYLEYVFIL